MSEQWFVLSYEETPGILLTSERDLQGLDSYDLETGKHIPDWNPNAFLRSASPKHDGEPEDVLADALGVPVFSARLREALHGAGIAPNDLQYLPVRVFKSTGEEVKGFAFANVVSRIAAVDYEHSFMLREDPSKVDPLTGRPEVTGIGKAALRAEMLIGHDVIRLLEYFAPVFVSERFVAVFQQGSFTGAAFRPVPVISGQQEDRETSTTVPPQHPEATGDLSPTELAKMLVSGVESLHTMATTKRQLDATGRSLLSLIVRSFLTCYREAQRVLTPTLPSFDRVRPVTHAGVQGNSYHEIAVRLSFIQYEQILMHLRPDIGHRSSPGHSEDVASEFQRFRGYEVDSQQVEDNWPAVAKGLSNVFPDSKSLSADSLRAEIDKEAKVDTE